MSMKIWRDKSRSQNPFLGCTISRISPEFGALRASFFQDTALFPPKCDIYLDEQTRCSFFRTRSRKSSLFPNFPRNISPMREPQLLKAKKKTRTRRIPFSIGCTSVNFPVPLSSLNIDASAAAACVCTRRQTGAALCYSLCRGDVQQQQQHGLYLRALR